MVNQEKRAARSAKQNRRRSRSSRRRRSSGWTNPLVWGVLGTVVFLVALGLWQSGAFATQVTASRSEDTAELLPLAEPRRPLRGSHDMALIPAATPAPQPRPANVSLPQLDVPNLSYDFGRVPKRPDVAHIFAVQNTGTADLEIRNLVTSCGCTTAELSSSIIPPGHRADLTVTFDPDFHPAEGEVVRLVWFATNDPAQPWVEVRITADIES